MLSLGCFVSFGLLSFIIARLSIDFTPKFLVLCDHLAHSKMDFFFKYLRVTDEAILVETS